MSWKYGVPELTGLTGGSFRTVALATILALAIPRGMSLHLPVCNSAKFPRRLRPTGGDPATVQAKLLGRSQPDNGRVNGDPPMVKNYFAARFSCARLPGPLAHFWYATVGGSLSYSSRAIFRCMAFMETLAEVWSPPAD